MKNPIFSTALALFICASLNSTAHAASGDLDGWRVTYQDMNCIADGSALDPQNNYVWTVRLVHPVQDQLTLLVGLYNSEVAKMFRGLPIKDGVKFFLGINGTEFQAEEFMFDKDGTLVLKIENSNTLQRSVSENTRFSIILQPTRDSEKFNMSTLHVLKAKPAFEWLRRCTVFGVRSIPD